EKSAEYAKLEAEGRRYVAAENGEEVLDGSEEDEQPEDTTVPKKRADQNSYSFNYNPQQAQGMPQQGMPQQGMQNPMIPYQNGGYQQQQQYNPFQQQQYSPYASFNQGYNPYQQQYNPYQQQSFMGQQAYGLNSL